MSNANYANFPQPTPPSDTASDQDRLIWMLRTILSTLGYLVNADTDPLFDFDMRTRFREQWAGVEIEINKAISTMQTNHSSLLPNLKTAGMEDGMLKLKGTALAECVDGLYREVQTGSPILGMKWLKPTMKCMNTILFSLTRAIPGIELVKEYKDHIEVGIDIVEARRAK